MTNSEPLSEDQAKVLVEQHLSQADARDRFAWSLQGFSEGWLVKREGDERAMGGNSIVVEKVTGEIRTFASSVPPTLIVTRYRDVRESGTTRTPLGSGIGQVIYPETWADLTGEDVKDDRQKLARELQAELRKGHPLYKAELTLVGRSHAKDDVLAALPDGTFAIVHLTYKHKENPPFPITTMFDTIAAVNDELAFRD